MSNSGHPGGTGSPVPVRHQIDDFAVDRATTIVNAELEKGRKAVEQNNALSEALDKVQALLARADDRIADQATQLRGTVAKCDSFMRYGAALTARLDTILGAVEEAERQVAQDTIAWGEIERIARDQGERSSTATALLTSLWITIQGAKDEARDTIWKTEPTDPPDGGAPQTAGQPKGGDGSEE